MISRTVLLVEDEAIVALDTAFRLEANGYTVLQVSTGEAAVQLAADRPEIGLVLMDIDLGKGIDGVDAAQEILKLRELPIVFLTSHTEPEYVERVRAVSRYGYVTKSAHKIVLFAALDTAFDLFTAHRELREKQEIFSRSEARLRRAQRIAHMGSWEFDMTNGTVHASEEAARIYGFSGESTIPEIQKVPLPEYRRVLDAALDDLIHRNAPYNVKFRIRRLDDGRIIPVHSVADYDPRTNTVTGTIQEIPEDRIRLEPAISALNAATWEWNIKTGETIFDDRWAEMIGYTLEELEPTTFETWTRLCHPEDLPLAKTALSEHFAGKTPDYSIEVRMLHKDGCIRWVITRGRVITRDIEGNPERMIGTHFDITEQRHREEALKLLINQKDALLHEVVHRTKNNMSTVASMLSLQRLSITDPQVEQLFLDAEMRIRAMTEIQEQLYTSHSFERVRLDGYFRSLSLSIVDSLQFDPPRVTVHLDLAPAEVDTDRAISLGLVLNELLTNIFKHAFPDGGTGTISITMDAVDLRPRSVTVADDGVGISDGFDLQKTPSLGLRLVSSLVEDQMGASLVCDSADGTRWTIGFPVESTVV